jgi:hypothetical protein
LLVRAGPVLERESVTTGGLLGEVSAKSKAHAWFGGLEQSRTEDLSTSHNRRRSGWLAGTKLLTLQSGFVAPRTIAKAATKPFPSEPQSKPWESLVANVKPIIAACIAALCTGCEQRKPAVSPVQTVDLPTAVNDAQSTCLLRPIRYVHGKLKDTFLIANANADNPLNRQAVFARRRLQVNTDGAENSYHSDRINADDRDIGAVNIICNANVKVYPNTWWSLVRRTEPIKCYAGRGISVEARYMEIYQAIRSSGWRPAEGHRLEFNWNILAKKKSSSSWPLSAIEPDRPCIDARGFFVSKTTLTHYHPKDECDQRAYINSNEQTAIVLPQHWFAEAPEAARWASFRPGDIAVAYRPSDGIQPDVWVYGIVGDAGPIQQFGEATLAFNWQLHRKNGNIREMVRTYKEAMALDTDMLRPQDVPMLVLEQTAFALGGDYSQANVEAKAREEFRKWGGETRFKACIEVIDHSKQQN